MAYDKKKLEKEAIEIAKNKKCLFIDEVVAFLPCTRSTFYNHELEKLDTIKEVLYKNRNQMMYVQNHKWYKSSNPTLQISLRKLIGTDDERKKLSTSYQDITTDGEKINTRIDLSGLSEQELDVLLKLHEKRNADNSGITEN
jgi:hypothetical protein